MDNLKDQLINFFEEAISDGTFPSYYTADQWAEQIILETQLVAKKEANDRQSNQAMADAIKHIEKAINTLSSLHNKKFDGTIQTHALERELSKLKVGYQPGPCVTICSLIQPSKTNPDETLVIHYLDNVTDKGKRSKNALLIQAIEAFWFSHTNKNEQPKQNPNSRYIELLAILTGQDNLAVNKQRVRALKGVNTLSL